jgi:hypothetical protein
MGKFFTSNCEICSGTIHLIILALTQRLDAKEMPVYQKKRGGSLEDERNTYNISLLWVLFISK